MAAALPEPDAITGIRQVGNDILPGFGTFTVVVSALALITVMAINAYGAMLTVTSAVDAFRPVRPSVRIRVTGVVAYSLVPWTAVNLVDFYFVRRGRYAITALFDRRGIYGSWSWRGLTAYAVGFGAMVPFFATSFYTGPAADALGGSDISFAVGLTVAGTLYYLFGRGLDSPSEQAALAADNPELGDRLSPDGSAALSTEPR